MKYTLALIATLVLTTTANAALVTGVAIDTPDLAGFKTVTLSVEAEAGESFRGFQSIFSGPLNQINPFGGPSIFQDANAAIIGTGGDVLQDSQFLFNSGDILSIPADAQEGANLLRATVSGLASLDPALPNPAAFVQLVVPVGSGLIGADVQVELNGDSGLPEPFAFNGLLSEIPGVNPMTGGPVVNLLNPLAPSELDFTNSPTGTVQFDNSGDGDLMVTGVSINGDTNSRFVVPQLGDFTENPADNFSIDVNIDLNNLPGVTEVLSGISLEIMTNGGNLSIPLVGTIPEPTTLAMAGLAMVGIVGLRRRS